MSTFGGEEVKSTWVTRRVDDSRIDWEPLQHPGLGDLVLCEVVKLGIHGRVETVSGSREKLYEGDRIVCAVGNRYATSLLEAVGELGDGDFDLVSASGVCGRVVQRAKKATTPTKLRALGQAFVGGRPVNVGDHALAPASVSAGTDPRWIVVVGSAMDSGKTTACTALIHGLRASGASVGAGKVTGTASARDFGSFRDAGARPFVDFLDFGWASTAGCTESELLRVLDGVADHLRAAGVEWAVLEIADGLLQADTNFLLGSLASHLGPDTSVVLTVRESLAGVAGVEILRARDLHVSAVSGLITNSPLSCAEVELACSVACVPTSELGRRMAKGRLAPRSASGRRAERRGAPAA